MNADLHDLRNIKLPRHHWDAEDKMKWAAAEIERLRAALKPFSDAYIAVQKETERLSIVIPEMDWQFGSSGYRSILGANIAPTWFQDAFHLFNPK